MKKCLYKADSAAAALIGGNVTLSPPLSSNQIIQPNLTLWQDYLMTISQIATAYLRSEISFLY